MSSTASSADLALRVALETALQDAVESGDIRSAVVGLYDDGDTRILSFGQSPTADTLFEIGSVSKVFTALLVQRQVSLGRLDWDDPIGKHLPDLEFANPAVASITLRELASHTSGLPRLPDNLVPEDPLDPYAGYNDADLLAFLGSFDPASLNKTYAYSNLGAGLLGYLGAAADGSDYATAMQRDVIAPLQLDDTSVGIPGSKKSRLARGYSQGADMPNWSAFDALAGAGALVSSAADMLSFIRQNLEAGKPGDDLDAIRQPQAAGDTGLGWHIDKLTGNSPVFWHNGGTGGYASYLGLQPESRRGIVILTASTEYELVTRLGTSHFSDPSRLEMRPNLEPYVGSYRLGDDFVLTVFVEHGALFGQATGQAPFALTYKSPDEFTFAPAGIRVVFHDLDDGAAQSLTLHQGGAATKAPRLSDEEAPAARTEIAVDQATLGDYTGRYQLTDTVVITVLVRGEQLYAQLTGQGAFPVFAYEPDRFFYKVVDAQLEFQRGDDGKVSAVALHQNGVQRATKID